MSNDFSTGLCNCFDDCGVCFVTWMFPCITVAQNQAMLAQRESTCCDYCCTCTHNHSTVILEYMVRQHIRSKYGFEQGHECGDCMVTICCLPLVICQHNRELKARLSSSPSGKSMV